MDEHFPDDKCWRCGEDDLVPGEQLCSACYQAWQNLDPHEPEVDE
jgi:hypothetical protein